MPGTPNFSWPVPLESDFVTHGAEAIRDLAAAIDATSAALMPKSGGTFTGNVTFTGFILGPSTGEMYVRLPAAGQRLVVQDGGGSNLGKIAHGYGAFANESATVGQLPSSKTVKENIRPGWDAAAAFDDIEPVRFTYKAGKAANDVEQQGDHLGFIAEHVKAAGVRVLEDPDGVVFGLQPVELIAVLWAKVAQLEDRVRDLEGDTP